MNTNQLSEQDAQCLADTVNAIVPMSDADLAMLAPLWRRKTVKRGDYILREGETSEHIFFLLSGLVRMYYVDKHGNDISYRFTSTSRFFVDFQSLLTGRPSRFFWQALQDSEMLVMAYRDVQTVYANSPAWDHFGRIWTERIYLELNERVELLLLMKPEERYLHVLNTQPELFTLVSGIHMASYLGIKPESLSRIRKRVLRR